MRIGDIPISRCMQRDVPTIGEEATVREGLDAVRESPFDCTIVLDAAQRPIGVVTEGDLLRRVLAVEVPAAAHLRAILTSLDEAVAHMHERHRAHSDAVTDLMTSPLLTVEPEDTLLDVSELFRRHHVSQFPVVKDGKLVGLLRRHDLMGEILEAQDEWAASVAGQQDADEREAAAPEGSS